MILLILAFVQTAFIPEALSAAPNLPPAADSYQVSLPENPTRPSTHEAPVFYADRATGNFVVFESAQNLDRPLKLGAFREKCGSRRIASLRNIHAAGNTYLFSDPGDPQYLSVSERLPNGGFGRLLRYRGWNPEGQWVDLEFIYEDRRGRITLLDYQSGKFYRTDLAERNETAQLFPIAAQIVEAYKFRSTASAPFKFLVPGHRYVFVQRPQGDSLDSLTQSSNKQEAWFARLLRGPPAGGQIS